MINNDNIPRDKFIVLNNMNIWQTPVSNYLLDSNYRPDLYLSDKKSYKIPLEINNIVKYFSGIYTVNSILKSSIHSAELILQILNLIIELNEDGFLSFLEVPHSNSLRVLGNTEYFVPLHLAIEVTNRCNLDCHYCYNYRNNNDISHDNNYTELINILEVSSKEGTQVCQITGGEPFIYTHIKDIIRQTTNLFSMVVISTNGTLLSNSMIEWLSDFKDKIYVQVSVDEFISGLETNNNYYKYFEHVKDVLVGLNERNIFTSISSTILPGRETDLSELIRISRQLGISSFVLSECGPWGRNQSLKRNILLEKTIVENYYYYNSIESFLSEENNCGAGWKKIALKSNGNIVPCLTFNDDIVIGNISYFRTWAEYNLNKYFDIRTPERQLCDDCSSLHKCRGCFSRPFALREKCKGYRRYYNKFNT